MGIYQKKRKAHICSNCEKDTSAATNVVKSSLLLWPPQQQQLVGGGGPDGQAISIKRAADRGRWRCREIVNENGAKNEFFHESFL